jgi:hypothetical protein
MLGMRGALLLFPTYAFMARKGQLYTCLFSYQLLVYHFIMWNVRISNYVPLFFNILSLTRWSKTQVSTMLSAFAEDIRNVSSRITPKKGLLTPLTPAYRTGANSIALREFWPVHWVSFLCGSCSLLWRYRKITFFSELFNKALQVYNSLRSPNASWTASSNISPTRTEPCITRAFREQDFGGTLHLRFVSLPFCSVGCSVRGQLYPRWNSYMYKLNRRPSEPQILFGRFGTEKNLLPVPGNEPRFNFVVQCDQQMHKLRKTYNNVAIRKLLHVSGPTGPSSGSSQLYKTSFNPSVIPSVYNSCMFVSVVCIGVDMCTYREHTLAYKPLQLPFTYPPLHSHTDELATILHHGNDKEELDDFLYNCALREDGPARPETCRSLPVNLLKPTGYVMHQV